ncbi:MAG: transglycosylase SLT domain-containing protein [Calditrichaeota bacterium]|nr:transglycosylase SLT domain-containing protein [Calditrichota bacterium]
MAALMLTSTLVARDLPHGKALAKEVAFWKRVFAKTPSTQYIIHDSDKLDIVYGVVTIADTSLSNRAVEDSLEALKKPYARMLRSFAAGKVDLRMLSPAEVAIYQRFAEVDEPDKFNTAIRRLRAQKGIQDNFKAGVTRSFAYLPYIRKVFREEGLPDFLVYLPHVESSFNPIARSHVGAAGMWQFMPGTARSFMKVNRVKDERYDPFKATHGAARMLSYNYRILQDWALAITAYNHGLGSMKKAKKRFGDYVTIRENYLRRSFGFASKNFYPEFLAVVEIMDSLAVYFPDIERHIPPEFQEIQTPVDLRLDQFSKISGIPDSLLRALNPGYREDAWEGRRIVPQNYTLRLPLESDAAHIIAQLNGSMEDYRKVRVVMRGSDPAQVAVGGPELLWQSQRDALASAQALKHLVLDAPRQLFPEPEPEALFVRATPEALPVSFAESAVAVSLSAGIGPVAPVRNVLSPERMHLRDVEAEDDPELLAEVRADAAVSQPLATPAEAPRRTVEEAQLAVQAPRPALPETQPAPAELVAEGIAGMYSRHLPADRPSSADPALVLYVRSESESPDPAEVVLAENTLSGNPVTSRGPRAENPTVSERNLSVKAALPPVNLEEGRTLAALENPRALPSGAGAGLSERQLTVLAEEAQPAGETALVASTFQRPETRSPLALQSRSGALPENALETRTSGNTPVDLSGSGLEAALAVKRGPQETLPGTAPVESAYQMRPGASQPARPEAPLSRPAPVAFKGNQVGMDEVLTLLIRQLTPVGEKTTVFPEETIGHFGDWLSLDTGDIRRLNGMKSGQALLSGQPIRISFEGVNADRFLRRRLRFHAGLLDHYFPNQDSIELTDYRVRSGDNLWRIANQSSAIPLNLLLYFNEWDKLMRLQPGDLVKLPVLER